MPLSLVGELGLSTPVDQLDKISICRRLIGINRRERSEKQDEEKEDYVQAANQTDTGLRLQHRSPVLVINESKPGQGLGEWQSRR